MSYFLTIKNIYVVGDKMNLIKNYKSTIILLSSIILGAFIGLIFKEQATILKPFGDLFLNMLLIIIVPLIFLSITTSIYKMNKPKRIGKILITTSFIFIITSIVSALLGMIITYSIPLVSSENGTIIKESLSLEISENDQSQELNILEKTINTISTNNFINLLSHDNMIALIVISILVGLSMLLSKESAQPVYIFLESANHILTKLIKLIMYYAPIGLCCYFASLIGTFGTTIATGYLKTFIIYLIITNIVYFIIYTIYAYLSSGIHGIKSYWKHIIPSTLTALATCSSAASMPINIENTKKIGVPNDIAETSISLGTSFHKDGSVIGSVFKIMFLVYLFNDFGNISFYKILIIALISTLLVTAVPIGGGTISETLIITMLGYSLGALPILTIIATIIDPPATVLNVTGDSAAAMLITRITDGKKWLKTKKVS